jgi:hypothetical protein
LSGWAIVGAQRLHHKAKVPQKKPEGLIDLEEGLPLDIRGHAEVDVENRPDLRHP